MRLVIRITGVIVGACAAAIAMLVPAQVVIDYLLHREMYARYPSHFWTRFGVWFFVLVLSGMCASVSYICLRYLTAYPPHFTSQNLPDRLFKSIGVASITVLLAAVLSQIVLLARAAFYVRQLPEGLRDSVQVRWSPHDWAVVRDSPYFLLPILVLYSAVFCWQYARGSRVIQQ